MQTQTRPEPPDYHAPIREAIKAAVSELESTHPVILKNAGSSRLWQARNMAEWGHVHPTEQPGIFHVDSSHITGQQYTVDAQAKSCTCPDAAKGNICKHRLATWIFRTAQAQLQDQAETFTVEHRAQVDMLPFLAPEVIAAIRCPPEPSEASTWQPRVSAWAAEMSLDVIQRSKDAWLTALQNLPEWYPLKAGHRCPEIFDAHRAFVAANPDADRNITASTFADYPVSGSAFYNHPCQGWITFKARAALPRISPVTNSLYVPVVAYYARPFADHVFSSCSSNIHAFHFVPEVES